jgi:NTE family protein
MSVLKSVYQHKLGYALSGGGARGFAHLGALKALEESGLKPDIIAGTSAGALAGVFYADGFHPEEVYELFRKKDFIQFVEVSLPKSGFFKSSRLQKFLKNNLRAKSFEELKIPFISVATDWVNAKTATFFEGKNLVESVVASCSIPIVFQPQYIDGVPYVDGGMFRNFPVSIIRESCKYVIGVNVSQIIPFTEKPNIRNMTQRAFAIMINSNTHIDRELCDILIEPRGINKLTMFDLNHIQKVGKIGYLSAVKTMQEEKSKHLIKRYLRYNELNEMMQEYIKNVKI